MYSSPFLACIFQPILKDSDTVNIWGNTFVSVVIEMKSTTFRGI